MKACFLCFLQSSYHFKLLYYACLLDSCSVLDPEVKDRYLWSVCLFSFLVLSGAHKLNKSLLERACLFFHSIVEVLSVEVVQSVNHWSEFGRNVLSNRFLSLVVDDPDSLILDLCGQSQALVFECHVFQVWLLDFNRDLLTIIVKFWF